MSLRPQFEEFVRQADATRAKATKVRPLSAAKLTWSPAEDRWSIARVLDHLNKTHALCIPNFEAALLSASPAGAERDRLVKYGFMDRVFVKMMGPKFPIKPPVPPMFEPDQAPDPKDAVRRFFELHDKLRALIEKADAYQLAKLKVVSPVSPKFRPGFVPYLHSLVLHEEYHWGQIEGLLADPNFPKSK